MSLQDRIENGFNALAQLTKLAPEVHIATLASAQQHLCLFRTEWKPATFPRSPVVSNHCCLRMTRHSLALPTNTACKTPSAIA